MSKFAPAGQSSRRSPAAPRRLFPILLLALVVGACASVAPGNDPVVVHAERVLIAAPGVYDSGMTWAEQNRATIPPGTLAVLERIRVSFPPAYRTADAALQTYKTVRKDPENVLALTGTVTEFLANLSALISSCGGPALWPPGRSTP